MIISECQRDNLLVLQGWDSSEQPTIGVLVVKKWYDAVLLARQDVASLS